MPACVIVPCQRAFAKPDPVPGEKQGRITEVLGYEWMEKWVWLII